jgi:extracellular elastinolytic metalloproteinase
MKKLLLNGVQLLLVVSLSLGGTFAFGQGRSQEKRPAPKVAMDHIQKNKQKLEVTDEDIADLVLSSESTSKKGIKHYYLKQQYQGIEIHGAVINVSVDGSGNVITMGNRFQKQVGRKVKGERATLQATDAVAAAARHLNISLREALTVIERGDAKSKEVLFSKGGISLENIPAKLVYQPMEDGSLVLAWEVSIYELDAQNYWSVRLDANTGELLEKDNMVVHCQFDNDGPGGKFLHDNHSHGTGMPNAGTMSAAPYALESMAQSNIYNVFPMPIESPSHGPRALVTPVGANLEVSPAGWHIETRTRGNNVFAYEDPNNNNNFNINYSPDGGADLVFDFPIDFTKQPVTYRDAAITNLFYWNNITHDVWYKYGFDEESGNFQLDNFGKDGLGGDPVLAEAQDNRNGTSRNNANFSTPRDGFAPRMQMYLWTSPADADMFTVVTPGSIAGSYTATEAAWARKLTSTPLVGTLALGQGTSGLPQEGCGVLTNPTAIAGKIAVAYRGTCPFTEKVEAAQAAGAIAVVIINNAPGAPIAMGGTPTVPITIPAVMISQEAGALIRARLDAGEEVTIRLKDDGRPELDGDFDNGIIVHEYGHGISNRLTGGRDIVNCLGNAEQMGEGWSDWFGLAMTMKKGDTPEKIRGIGTYAVGQPTDGRGIRPAPYSTDFSVNNFTYAATNNTAISQPHGIGFVWSTMLWDMTWDLIGKYGFSEDFYNGKAGNNMAMQLVIDGLKLQACRPGFVDGRDAILLADRINYGGANQELIWRAFAKRGLGFSASQGLSTSRLDQVEAFDLPASYPCTTPLSVAAVATNNVFTGGIASNVYLGYGPQNVQLVASGDASNSYTWSPAVGLSDANIANPIFTPTAAGVYTFTVKSVNSDQCTKYETITITVVDVRCAPEKEANTGKGKNNKPVQEKVLVCVDGVAECANITAVPNLLTRAGGTLGSCANTMTTATVNTSAAREAGDRVLEAETSIRNYPNPFTGTTTLNFTVKESGFTTLRVYDVMGKLVATLYEGDANAGQVYSQEFKGEGRAKGVYFYRLINGSTAKTGSMLMER